MLGFIPWIMGCRARQALDKLAGPGGIRGRTAPSMCGSSIGRPRLRRYPWNRIDSPAGRRLDTRHYMCR